MTTARIYQFRETEADNSEPFVRSTFAADTQPFPLTDDQREEAASEPEFPAFDARTGVIAVAAVLVAGLVSYYLDKS